MQLTVKFMTGEPVTLDVSSSMTIAQLKSEIQHRTGVSSSQQRLVVQNGQTVELQDGHRLEHYNIPPNSTVMMVVKKEEPMTIFLKNTHGRTNTYSVLPSLSVSDFKKKVQQMEQVPADQQRLIYEGKQLEDGHRLCDYNIWPETTIFLTLRLRGG